MNSHLQVEISGDDLKAVVGRRIREALRRHGRTVNELAAHLNVKPNTVRAWLDGINAASIETLMLIGRWLGIDHREFTPPLVGDPTIPPGG